MRYFCLTGGTFGKNQCVIDLSLDYFHWFHIVCWAGWAGIFPSAPLGPPRTVRDFYN